MRFDDSLDTVLAADMSGPAAVEWTWRQLVDLIGRRRAEGPSRAHDEAIARLHAIRPKVSRKARLAAARGLERANPPAALVALFADQELAVAAPVVRGARLAAGEWVALLPAMMPATRGIMRLRTDLPEPVVGALAAFGPTDFVLYGELADVVPALSEPESAAKPDPTPVPEPIGEPISELGPPRFVPPEPNPFMTIAEVARTMPLVVEAIEYEDEVADTPDLSPQPIEAPEPTREDFEIPALVARIAAHQRTGGGLGKATGPRPAEAPATSFRFETNAAGLIRWVEGVERGPLIGLSLTAGRDGRPAHVDGVAAGALAHRGRFSDARLEVGGTSDAAGSWRISGAPVFDHASGRFTGYRGTARRPRADEAPHPSGAGGGDALRQLVHELRTPANAISGFAEMIEHQLLGPVPDAYREQAASIRGQTVGLLDAIDDLDTAARLETKRLDLRAEQVALAPLADRILSQLAPLAQLRDATITIDMADAVAAGDAVAIERLLSRFLTALVSSARAGERIAGQALTDKDHVVLSMSRPVAFVAPGGALFDADAEAEAAAEDGPLLGTGFGFRLARRLASELGGSLSVEAEALTLRLPAAVDRGVEQATR